MWSVPALPFGYSIVEEPASSGFADWRELGGREVEGCEDAGAKRLAGGASVVGISRVAGPARRKTITTRKPGAQSKFVGDQRIYDDGELSLHTASQHTTTRHRPSGR